MPGVVDLLGGILSLEFGNMIKQTNFMSVSPHRIVVFTRRCNKKFVVILYLGISHQHFTFFDSETLKNHL